jgi:hypothetical protein
MTTRKSHRPLALAVVLNALALLGGGCATPGALHIYSLPSAAHESVHDTGPEGAVDVPSFLAADETLTALAYDPFTDHFFLRLAPGNRIRVVDRPARAIKREFKLAALPATGGGDLAIRPRDGHVFALVPTEAAIVEFTRYGEFVRRFALAGLAARAAGLAYDQARDQLFVLGGRAPAVITTHALDGRQLASVALDQPITPSTLAYDADKKEFYAPLDRADRIGVFGEDGHLRRTLPERAIFVDVGPRSFLRMF